MDHSKLEDMLKYTTEADRLASFKQKWVFPDNASCSAKKMAEAGFVFIGNKRDPDSVKCFFCDKALDGWEEDDCPWSEHLKHSKNCEFAKLQQSEGTLTMYQFLELVQKYRESVLDKFVGGEHSELENKFETILEKIDKIIDKHRV